MDETVWNERYADREYVWTVEANQFVRRHLDGVPPGTAIDLGAGEGRNAVWLAQRGWRVVAVDFSETGLDKARRLAADHGVAGSIELVHADARTWQAGEPVDLVVLSYLQLPSAEQVVVLDHAAGWVRPGGTVFVVAHDRNNVTHGHGGPSVEDVCYDLERTVTALGGLEVVTAEVAERHVETPAGVRTALDTLVIARRPRPA